MVDQWILVRPTCGTLSSSIKKRGDSEHHLNPQKYFVLFACLCFTFDFSVHLQEREKEGLVEQADRLETIAQDNAKLMQKIAGLEGQVSAHEHCAALECANPSTLLNTCKSCLQWTARKAGQFSVCVLLVRKCRLAFGQRQCRLGIAFREGVLEKLAS